MKINDFLFVYGTLRQTGRFHHLLDGCDMVGRGKIRGTMYSLHGMCPIVDLTGETDIIGEVYCLGSEKVIQDIQRLERGYDLSSVEAQTEFDPEKVWVFHSQPNPDRYGDLPVVTDGDWIKYSDRVA